MTELCITLSRDRILNANERLHWAVKAKKTKHLRQVAAMTAQANRARPYGGIVRVDYLFQYPDRRRPLDRDNLRPSVKALTDGLTDAGLFPDDSDEYIDGPIIRIDREPTRDPRKLIRILISITPV